MSEEPSKTIELAAELIDQGEHAKALFLELISIKRVASDANFELGVIAKYRGHLEAAKRYFERSVETDEGNFQSKNQLKLILDEIDNL